MAPFSKKKVSPTKRVAQLSWKTTATVIPGLNKGASSKSWSHKGKEGKLADNGASGSGKCDKKKRPGATKAQLRIALGGVFIGVCGKLWSVREAARKVGGLRRAL